MSGSNLDLWEMVYSINSELAKPAEPEDRFTTSEYHGPRPGEKTTSHNYKPRKPKPFHGGNNRPGVGEIPLKQWIALQAELRGRSTGAIENMLSRGQIPYPEVRRVNSRVVFVKI